jgi:hypothetical protein
MPQINDSRPERKDAALLKLHTQSAAPKFNCYAATPFSRVMAQQLFPNQYGISR